MILLKLKGEKVIGVAYNMPSSYQPQSDEVLVEALPQVDLLENEIAYIYYRNGLIEYEKKVK